MPKTILVHIGIATVLVCTGAAIAHLIESPFDVLALGLVAFVVFVLTLLFVD